jgi:hypothetical protein
VIEQSHSLESELCTSPADLKLERNFKGIFLPNDNDMWSGKLFANIIFPKSSQGKVMQSITINPISCEIYASVSLQTKPDTIGLWSFKSINDYSLYSEMFTQMFGHGTDLSREVDTQGKVWVWLSDDRGVGAHRFWFDEQGGKLIVRGRQFVRFLNEPTVPKSQLVSISADGRYLVSTGRKRDADRQPVMVRVYEMDEIHQHLGRDTIAEPAFEWPLAKGQQKRQNYRQGIAILGSSIFVLSGNNKAHSGKWIYTYHVTGLLLSKQRIGVGFDESFTNNEFGIYEPEGLEIITRNSVPHLLVGIATGRVKNRINRIYSIRLRKL